MCHAKKTVPMNERKRKSMPANREFQEKTLSTAISKLVMRLVRRGDQDERENDGAVIGIRRFQNCWKPSETREQESFRTKSGFNASMKEATRRGSSTAKVLENPWCIFVQFEGTLGESWSHLNWWVISPFHTTGKSLSSTGVVLTTPTLPLKPDSLQDGRESKEGRQTIFLTPPNPFGDKSRWRS